MAIRVKISEFGIIQNALALATVVFYELDTDGTNTGNVAVIYEAITGTGTRQNPQVLDENGKLTEDCYVELAVMASISNISDRTERSLKKIKQNPLEFGLPITSSNFSSTNALSSVALCQASAVSTAADAVQTALDVIQTGADRVQTGLDVISTASDVVATGISETNAAASAVTAASYTPQRNDSGGRAPLVTDDSASGYAIHSTWIDDSVSPNEMYRCFDASVGSADWQPSTFDATDVKAMAFLDKATQSEAEAGTLDTVGMTPLRTKQAIDALGGGKVLGQAYVDTGALITTTTLTYNDDTIPQNTEGAELLTLAYTPVSATSKIVIEVGALVSCTGNNTAIMSIFIDTTANALATLADFIDGGTYSYPSMVYEETSGSTTARTYKLRAGGITGVALNVNGQSGARKFGGVAQTYIKITEIEV